MREIAIDSGALDWVETQWPGIHRKPLRNDPNTGARASLLKLDADGRIPMHMHPAGEEVFVLEGRVRFEDDWYEAGYYMYSPPGSSDDVYTDTGAVLSCPCPSPTSISSDSARPDLSTDRGILNEDQIELTSRLAKLDERLVFRVIVPRSSGLHRREFDDNEAGDVGPVAFHHLPLAGTAAYKELAALLGNEPRH